MPIYNSISTLLDLAIINHLHASVLWDPALPTNTYQVPTNGINVYGAWIGLNGGVAVPVPTSYLLFTLCNPIVSALPADGVYQVELGTGIGGFQVPVTSTKYYLDAVAGGSLPREPIPLISPEVPAGTLVWVRARCNLAAVQVLDMTLGYHFE